MTENALDCPIESCRGGEISWAAVEGQNLVTFNAGTCYAPTVMWRSWRFR